MMYAITHNTSLYFCVFRYCYPQLRTGRLILSIKYFAGLLLSGGITFFSWWFSKELSRLTDNSLSVPDYPIIYENYIDFYTVELIKGPDAGDVINHFRV